MVKLISGTVYPTSKVMYEGGSTVFFCGTNSTSKWFKNGIPILFNTKIMLTMNIQLRLTDVTENDAGNYSCIGTTEDGSCFTAYSDLKVGG